MHGSVPITMKPFLAQTILFASLALAVAPGLQGQMLDPLATPPSSSQFTDPSENPGRAFLFDLEARFARATATGGGAAFSSYFADDAVTLSNGKAAVTGRAAIAAAATWSPREYQLTWTPQGGQMSPSGDMGFTWGHYEGHAKDRNGNSIVSAGRYMTIWRKQSDGSWKVVLDSSNDEPPAAGDCCKIP
ncbi:MAG TPA: nuclear transport factor 2 family protein [Acidisarcina sp.]|nr:nuclear transport factor 2 family protein [Acidisarcina sp.]